MVWDDPKVPDDNEEKYPNLNGGVDNSIPGCEIFSLLDENLKVS